MEKNRAHLHSVTDRIKLAQARVQKIKGSKKATKVRNLDSESVTHRKHRRENYSGPQLPSNSLEL